MAHLFTTRTEPAYRIFGPGPEDERGPWSCSCPNGRRHLGPRVGGVKPGMCKHLTELLTIAKERGELSGRFRATPSGTYRADNCRCSGAEEAVPLIRLPPPKPPPAPIPGQPSRNRPCPCGSGTIYKWCEGPPGAPHPRGAWKLEDAPAPVEAPTVADQAGEPRKGAKRVKVPLSREERAERIRAGQIEAGEKRAKRLAALDEILERARAKDEARREKARQRRTRP